MGSPRILIAMNNEVSSGKLKTLFSENGYIVAGQVSDDQECLRRVRALGPDLVVLDYDLPISNGLEVAKILLEDKLCDVILIATESQKTLAEELSNDIGFSCISKPIGKTNLLNTVDLMFKARKKINTLEKEITDLKEVLSTRKEVEKAKGLLMKHLNLSEAEAFKRIQKQSMDKGISMKEISKAIILAYDI
ncbi:ANTAR domain-containing response regulator [Pseudobacteroides cellulosolvens]|uniref:Stage 0 sporulation protein A homolog n=1 Tax=Pseudobacteroides cellulosolvens ATCC 35603 = DSM 2933 TaxID=398512 RepID=A0A0L6JY46_9FIRM|nr:ANTAR domain-containing protein [Pseudobacteroides cellulosolvens]KNY30377.1 response regulator receiver and ANTAR domain protein [Pseudobacteroides cellulosolvens ATCC 35603 = DSM 2933]